MLTNSSKFYKGVNIPKILFGTIMTDQYIYLENYVVSIDLERATFEFLQYTEGWL